MAATKFSEDPLSSAPRVSWLMPVRNGEVYLESCLASVRAQTRTDYELVIVDDASSDSTPDLVAAAARTDPRIRHIRLTTRGGIVGALNTGLEAAQAELIARIDCDDLALPTRLDLQVAYLEAHPEVVAVGGRILFIDEDGDELGSPVPVMGHEAIDAFHLTGRGGALCHGASVFRRAAVVGIGAYRPEFSSAEDLDLFLRLAEVGRLANMPEVIHKVRLHPLSHSLDTRADQRQQSRKALQDAHRRRGDQFNEADFRFPEPVADTFGSEEFFARFALAHDRLHAARKHALRQVLREPFKTRSLRTLAAVARHSLCARFF